MATFGERLRDLREEKGIKQTELAALLNLSSSATISQYESNKRVPDAHILEKLANILDCSVDYILGRTNVRAPLKNNFDKNIDSLSLAIETLSEESKKELEKYVRLLKIKDDMDKTKDETSSALEKNA